ncbi:MAG: FecR family protein [Mangrovibacterium sp.]
MKKDTTIPEYVFDYLHGKASEQQRALTEIWLMQPDNKLAFDQMKKIISLSGDLKLFEKFDLQEGKDSVHDQMRKNKQIRLMYRLQKIAALLLLPVLVYAGWSFLENNRLKKEMASVQVSQEIRTQPGIRSFFVLPDGSKVWLNSASTIKFPSVFNDDTRTIELDGEAYFEVAENKSKPFIVKSGTLDVTALGTAFNLCAYSDDSEISTTLAEGKVIITTYQGKEEQYILEPHEQLNFGKYSFKVSKNQVNVYNVIAWKDGKLIFSDTPFHEVVQKLGRWFNTDIKLADESIANYRYTATFTNENLSQVMELLTFSAPIEFTSTHRQMQKNNNFSREQIIIRVKPDAILDTNTKNKMPMKQ